MLGLEVDKIRDFSIDLAFLQPLQFHAKRVSSSPYLVYLLSYYPPPPPQPARVNPSLFFPSWLERHLIRTSYAPYAWLHSALVSRWIRWSPRYLPWSSLCRYSRSPLLAMRFTSPLSSVVFSHLFSIFALMDPQRLINCVHALCVQKKWLMEV